MKRAFLVPLLVSILAARLQSVTVPPGFIAHSVASSGGWQEVVGLEAAPDGRLFVIEKGGRVHVVKDNVKLPVPFLDLEAEVLNNGDRGLLGVALDPGFTANGRVYLLYTVDPNGDGVDEEGPAYSRLASYTASRADPNIADPASRRVILGGSWATGIPSIYNTHTIGSVRFGEDGTLLVSAGEGAHSDSIYTRAAGRYRYSFALTRPGTYEVFAWWTTIANRSPRVPYRIQHAGGSTTVYRSQLAEASRWVSLGTFTFESMASVTIVTRADGKSYCADAVRLRKTIP